GLPIIWCVAEHQIIFRVCWAYSTSTLQHFNTSTHYRRSPDGDVGFFTAEPRRYGDFFGGTIKIDACVRTPESVPETFKDRRAGSPGRRLSLHSKKLRLNRSANHLVRGGTSDHFPCVLGGLSINTFFHRRGGEKRGT